MNVHGFIFPARIIGVLILLAAIVPGGIGIWLYTSTRSFLEQAVSAQGNVVEVRPGGGRDGTSYNIVFEYQDESGTTHEKVSRWASNPPTHSVGERVEVLYVPGDPSDARIRSFMSLWAGPAICGVTILFPLVFGIGFIWLVPFTIRRVWPEPSSPDPQN